MNKCRVGSEWSESQVCMTALHWGFPGPTWPGHVTEGMSLPGRATRGFPPHWNVAPASGTKFTLKGHSDQNVLCCTIRPLAPSLCVQSRAASSSEAEPCQLRWKATHTKPAHSGRRHTSDVKEGKAGARGTGPVEQGRCRQHSEGVMGKLSRQPALVLNTTSSRSHTPRPPSF